MCSRITTWRVWLYPLPGLGLQVAYLPILLPILFQPSREILSGASQFHLWHSQCLPTWRILFSPPALTFTSPKLGSASLCELEPIAKPSGPQLSPLKWGEQHRPQGIILGGRADSVRKAPSYAQSSKISGVISFPSTTSLSTKTTESRGVSRIIRNGRRPDRISHGDGLLF